MIFKKLKFSLLIISLFGFSIISNAQKIEVENGQLSKGLKIEKKEDGKAVGFIKNNSSILLKLKKINSKVKTVSVNISSFKGESKIEVLLNSLDSKPIAIIDIPKTGGYSDGVLAVRIYRARGDSTRWPRMRKRSGPSPWSPPLETPQIVQKQRESCH